MRQTVPMRAILSVVLMGWMWAACANPGDPEKADTPDGLRADDSVDGAGPSDVPEVTTPPDQGRDRFPAPDDGKTDVFVAADDSESPDDFDLSRDQPDGEGVGPCDSCPSPEEQSDADQKDSQPEIVLPPAPAARSCIMTMQYRPSGVTTSVTMPGDFNGWNQTALPLLDDDHDGVYSVDLTTGPAGIPAGRYGYKFLVNGTEWIRDPGNPQRIWDPTGVHENSLLIVTDCRLPLLTLESSETDPETGLIRLRVMVQAGNLGEPIDAASWQITLNHEPLTNYSWYPESQRLDIEQTNLAVPGKYTFRLSVASAAGRSAELTLPVWLEAVPFSWQDAILYFAMTDRFSDGDAGNNGTLNCPELVDPKAGWYGGDWIGLQRKIEQGYFDGLGVNALWISAPQDNPDGCYAGLVSGKKYAAYHGYFPNAARTTENHFGSLQDLRNLIETAHAHGIRVLADLVINHTFEDHPWYGEHRDWFNTNPIQICRNKVCAADDCPDGWNAAPITCWFESYLPDINYRKDEAVQAMIDDALWWIREANLDGFRVDAVKHVEDAAVLDLRAAIQGAIETTGVPFYMVGETFVGEWDGPGGGQVGLIRHYVGDSWLHGQFDFPLYWRVLHAFAYQDQGLQVLSEVVSGATAAYGAQAIMSNFLGNHDVARFASRAAGQVTDFWGNAPFNPANQVPPGLPVSVDAYQRLQQTFAFLLTIPGIPLIYQGDEVAMPGLGDPDNRRPLQFDALSGYQSNVWDRLARFCDVRRAKPALRRGAIQFLVQETEHLAYSRRAGDDGALILLNRSATAPWPVTISVSGTGWTVGQQVMDALSETSATVAENEIVQVTVPSQLDGGVMILVQP